MKTALRFSVWTTLLLIMTQGAFGQATTNTWTGADPSGYWSAPGNWSPPGVPASGNDLVFPGGLPAGDLVSTNDLPDSSFRSITFAGASRHTIRGNPITLTNRLNCIINSGTNVIACDLTFTGTPAIPHYLFQSIRGFSGELTVIGNVGGSSLYVFLERMVIRGQFTGGSLRVQYGSLALYGDNPHPVSVEFYASSYSTLRVQGSQPNLNITRLREMESAECPSVSGDGLVGDVLGCGSITPDPTLSVKNVTGRLDIKLNGTNVSEYGRLIASGDVNLSGRLLPSPGFNPQSGQIYTIVEKTSPGPITGEVFGPEGSISTLNGRPFRISYVGGDGNDVTLTAHWTNTPPTVTITNPVNNAVFIAPATFTVDASASDPDGNVSHVGFFLNSTSLGADMVSPYSVNVNNLPAGTYTLRAVATDNQNASATNSITVTVNAPPPFDPTFRDANWISIAGINAGFAGIQDAVVDSLGNLYVAGYITISGVAENIAKWNGTSWSALGSTALMTNLSALAVSGSDLYVGGDFRMAGGRQVNSIAKWNGTNWSGLGTGMGGSVYALAVSGSNLYAGGRFAAAGGTWATNIAKWDGSSWSAVPGSGMNHYVRALMVSGSDLYAGGEVITLGITANRVAKWDGSSWSQLGGNMNFDVHAVALSGSDLYAGGSFTTVGGTPANGIAKWNGNTWSPLGSGLRGGAYALAVLGSDLYAGGSFTMAGGSPATNIAKWDGTTWTPLGSGVNDAVYALPMWGNHLYAGGWFTTAGGKASVNIAKVRIASAAESITASGSVATIQFSGVIGYQYHVQRTASLTPPVTWTTLTTSPLSLAADGSLTFTDTTAPAGTAYYRLVQH